MSETAGNASALSTAWTYDTDRQLIRNDASNVPYLAMGRLCSILGILVSIATAYLGPLSKSIMDYVQAVASLFVPQLFGTVLLGILGRRTTPQEDSGASSPEQFPPLLRGRGFELIPVRLQ